jgi:hypothetical protein
MPSERQNERMSDLTVHDLRKYVSWCFAVESLLNLVASLRSILYVIHRHYAFPPLHNLLDVGWFSVLAFVFGVASWAVWRGKATARGWGIAASLGYLLIFLRPIVFPPRSIWGHLGALVVGTIGMVAFLRRDEQHDLSKKALGTADSG